MYLLEYKNNASPELTADDIISYITKKYSTIIKQDILSINKIKILSLFKAFLVLLFSLFMNIINGPKKSSSLIVICKKTL